MIHDLVNHTIKVVYRKRHAELDMWIERFRSLFALDNQMLHSPWPLATVGHFLLSLEDVDAHIALVDFKHNNNRLPAFITIATDFGVAFIHICPGSYIFVIYHCKKSLTQKLRMKDITTRPDSVFIVHVYIPQVGTE